MAWVKKTKYPWWPVKINYNDSEANEVHGYFFEDGTKTGPIKVSNCRMFSWFNPGPPKYDSQRDRVSQAQRVRSLIIDSKLDCAKIVRVYFLGSSDLHEKC